MPKIIGVIQVKGGAGRSTVSTNLAGELAKLGSTVLVDCDMPQGTSSSWFAMRQQAGRDEGLELETATTYRELAAILGQHQDADYIVLDGPPRIADITRMILGVSDLALVPIGASKAEVWASTDILEIIKEARKEARVNARLVWTRNRPNTRLSHEVIELAATELKLPELETKLAMRVAYPEALGEGLTAAEIGDSIAKGEAALLVNECLKLLKKGK